MGISAVVLIVLVLFGVFALGAIVIGILTTGSRSRRGDDASSAAAESTWMAGAAYSGAVDDAHRHPHHADHHHGSAPGTEPNGDAGGDSGSFDGGSDGGTSDGGGSDGGGAGGDGGGGGGD